MKVSKIIIALLLTAGISAAYAAKPPPQAQEVIVINDDTQSVPVTVQNPQTSVTVDNTTPIPVDVQGGITINATELQFVGFSNDVVLGDVGLVGEAGGVVGISAGSGFVLVAVPLRLGGIPPLRERLLCFFLVDFPLFFL